MFVKIPSEVGQPEKNSIVWGFLTAPTLIKVLAGSLYLSALLAVIQTLFAGLQRWGGPPVGPVASPAGVGIAAMWALISLLLGTGIARGSHRTWTLTLVLSGLWLLYDISRMFSLYSRSRVQTVITVAVLALLFNPNVRRYRTRTGRG
jgi:hypothetical protein